RPADRRHRRLRSGAQSDSARLSLGRVRVLVRLDRVTHAARMIDPDTFRSVLGRFASGVTIVTARDGDGADHGMTVSAFCSLSLEPPLVLICVDHAASMHGLLLTRPALGVSILGAHQEAISRRFADTEDERFDGIAYVRGESGVVLL